MTRIYRIIPFAIFMLLVIFLWRGLTLDPQKLPSAKVGQQLPKLNLPALLQHEFLQDSAFKGKVSLLNVWASWCYACTQEQWFLLKLAREGVAIYGLDYKDPPQDAESWLNEWGNPYKMIGSDLDGKAAIDLGVYGAPETFLIDKKGTIRHRHVGVLNEVVWQREFLPLVKQLEQAH